VRTSGRRSDQRRFFHAHPASEGRREPQGSEPYEKVQNLDEPMPSPMHELSPADPKG
jgi:hypothetical protein